MTVKVRADTSDASTVARKVLDARTQIKPTANVSARILAQGAVFIFRANAPRASGRLGSGIRVLSGGGSYTVRVDARNPATGYDYVGVTRKGHGKIVPRHDRAPASVIATGRGRQTGRKAMLRFVIGGRVIYARSVKAWRPAHDWVQTAYPGVRRLADSTALQLARRIESLFR